MKKNNENVWNTNTDLGCDVKTLLRSDVRMKTSKEYQGVICMALEGLIEK